jgi:predicted nuclease of predicted toxin-antitoxin system
VKFLVDAQLPKRLSDWLCYKGFDAIHTLDLPQANASSDLTIIEIADQQQRVVITKDADFVDAFHLRKQPQKLLLVTTGNLNNKKLLLLFSENLEKICAALSESNFIELSTNNVVLH